MVTVKAKIGSKGQIVIPKILREEYNIKKNTELILRDTGQGILLQRPHLDIAEEFARLARQHGKIVKVDVHAIEKQYEERMKRSGLL
ncbi:AbrB/MazE/SpoVT family DNA-binding domain-containing protein [Candidatus Woesearchaeota archaeon]|nr:AbrB/MazE/SpoVT family DNA-binding domain-containing protein [Candidatus Woesearchaeota archaeon]